MPFFDYFRNFLGAKRRNEPGTSGLDEHNSPRDSFRNPIWQNDDDDEVDIDEFIFTGNNMHFNIFSDPLEMAWYFESQMDNMLKNFGFGHNSLFRMLPDGTEDMKALPFAERDEPKKNIDLRDKMLKLKPEIFGDQNHEQRIDTDVDGKITTEEFSKLWNRGDLETTVKPSASHSFSFGKSVRKEIVRKPDGTVERKQVIRDSEGNEETIVSKEIGDKRYIITTKKDKNGVETKSEDLFNMNENELKEFTQNWTSKSDTNANTSLLNRFPWEMFFGPSPKL